MMKRTVIHVITDLTSGGAEAVLFTLCKATQNQFDHIIVSMKGRGKYGELLEKEGFQVHTLGIVGFVSLIKGGLYYSKIIRQHEYPIIQTWLYHGDFFGGLIAKSLGINDIYWGIHNTDLVIGKSKLSTILLVKILSIFSYFVPKKIICCANSARLVHQDKGYCSDKLRLIYNGYDLMRFMPNIEIGRKFRQKISVSNDCFLIGMVARNDPQKDHCNLFDALCKIKLDRKLWKCLVVGADVRLLKKWVDDYKLSEQVILFGECDDIPSVMNSLDVHVLSSAYGEACPNVLAEAMACSIPCIATDVGDSKRLLGQFGRIVPARSSEELAHAIHDFYKKSKTRNWKELKKNCRSHVIRNFTLQKMINGYRECWLNIK